MIYLHAASNKKNPARSRERILVEEELALSGLVLATLLAAMSRLLALLPRLVLSATTLLAALSRILLTTLLTRLLLSAALLARLLFTRVHNSSFVVAPQLTTNPAL
jgi:hypothetical protein